jgi:MFS family permease
MSVDTGARARAYRAYVLALLVLVGVAGWVDRNVLAVLLESIKTDLSLSDTELGLLGGAAFGLFYATVGLPVAWLADRYSRSALIAISLALWSVLTAACGLAGGFGSLFLARLGVGIGEAGG